uniref:Putative inwardly rectifying k+ channel n=1 Tax=Anopheles braziliensis TaxID=58242 RepID=A0A2M3ZM59_9DIPT
MLLRIIIYLYIMLLLNPFVSGSSKSMFEKRWHQHYTNTIRTLSTVHLEDEQTSLTVQPRYLTIHAAPRRPRSYLQLENNLRNLFDRPSITISPSSVTSIRTDSR